MNKLELSEYQKLALITKANAADTYEDCRHSGCGLFTEVGEIIDTYKRHWFYKKDLDVKNLREEVGDVLWYVAIGLFSLGLTMQDYLPSVIEEEFGKPEISLETVLAKLGRYSSNVFVCSYAYPNEWEEVGLSHDFYQVLVFLRFLAEGLGFSLEEAAWDNIQKLAKRYPDGFTEFHALNRDKENELSHIKEKEKNEL